MDFSGKLALVTGASRGIGRAIAGHFADVGADVVVHYRREAAAAEAVAAGIRTKGRRCLVVQGDIGVEADVHRIFDTIKQDFGYLDFFVANAASTAFKTVAETKPHNIDLTFAVVVKSLILGVQRSAELMRGRGGKIVTISGMDARRFVPRHSTLGGAKAAMEALTRYFACELADEGNNVNCDLPGPTRTESLDVMLTKRGDEYIDSLNARAQRTARRRLGRPEDVAPVVAFLCSEGANWIVGQTIIADGGFLLTVDPFQGPVEEVRL
jgi:enoyl-[acyl-carrier protein] reductase III